MAFIRYYDRKGNFMSCLNVRERHGYFMADFSVAGRQFRTQADYKAALRDQTQIDTIKTKVNMDQPGEFFRHAGHCCAIIAITDIHTGRHSENVIQQKR